jgi:hypothetical protein
MNFSSETNFLKQRFRFLRPMILAQISAEAEAIAPKVEWCKLLAEDDLPVDLDEVIRH